jgi:hypothetical protein
LRLLFERYKTQVVQIYCHAPGEVLFERFTARAKGTERHPGHDDNHNLDEFRERLVSTEVLPLEIGGRVISVDTTDMDTMDVSKIVQDVQASLSDV